MAVRMSAITIFMATFAALLIGQTAGASPPKPETRGNPRQSLAIVVNRSNPTSNLSFGEMRKIFLGERNLWPDGHRIVVAMLDYGPERRTVLRLVYRMDEGAYEDHFLRGVFRGDVFFAAKTLASPLIMRRFVFNAPGAIGYLRASDVDDSVKVVRIDGLAPENKDYRLQIDQP